MIPFRISFPVLILTAAALASCKAVNTAVQSTACVTELSAPVSINGGMARIGSDQAYPEEAPKRGVSIEDFDIDATEVTNAQFAEFVAATGYVTDAEKPQAGFDAPGGAVFKIPSATNPSWWTFTEGANWRHPEGPDSNIEAKDFEPVVQVSLADAQAYAKWKGRRLPTEAEWEYAAKAGADTLYVWGETRAPGGQEQANTWQGIFPVTNSNADGYVLRAPVGCYEANTYGLYDMIGNVWEWTDTPSDMARDGPAQQIIKGGSFLCAENYCRRYRASARQPQDVDFSTNHIGFRTVKPQ